MVVEAVDCRNLCTKSYEERIIESKYLIIEIIDNEIEKRALDGHTYFRIDTSHQSIPCKTPYLIHRETCGCPLLFKDKVEYVINKHYLLHGFKIKRPSNNEVVIYW